MKIGLTGEAGGSVISSMQEKIGDVVVIINRCTLWSDCSASPCPARRTRAPHTLVAFGYT